MFLFLFLSFNVFNMSFINSHGYNVRYYVCVCVDAGFRLVSVECETDALQHPVADVFRGCKVSFKH